MTGYISVPGPGDWPRPQLRVHADISAGSSRLLLLDSPAPDLVEVRLILRPGLDRLSAQGMAALACLGAPGAAFSRADVSASVARLGVTTSRSTVDDAVVLSAFGPAGSGVALARVLLALGARPGPDAAAQASAREAERLRSLDGAVVRDRLAAALVRPAATVARAADVEAVDPSSVCEAADVSLRGSTALVVVGTADESALTDLLTTDLLTRRSPDPSAGTVVTSPGRNRRLMLDKQGAGQVDVIWGAVTPPRGHPDRAAAEVAVRLLGGGATSMLSVRLRERDGIAYSATSSWSDGQYGSVVLSQASVAPARAGDAVGGMGEVIAELGERDLDEGHVAVAARGIAGRLAIDISTPAGIADHVAARLAVGDAAASAIQDAVAAEEVTPEAVTSAARTWLAPDHQSLLLIGDRSAVHLVGGDEIEDAARLLGEPSLN